MRRFLLSLIVLSTPMVCFADPISIIPQPQKVVVADGHFSITPQTQIFSTSPATNDAADALAVHLNALKLIRKTTGAADDSAPGKGAIVLTTSKADPTLGDEGYTLDVTADSVVIRASQPAGMFYGVQTLLQLLPPAVYSASPAAGTDWNLPCVHIEDKPRFKWRGLMLDVSRHYEPKEMVFSYLDQMAMHKLNVFHWHLTDDQGWRIEIKKYPRLTEIGAWREKAGFDLDPKLSTTYDTKGRYGGFYTQDDIRQVIAYATRLHIMIVPEIEMPGHSTAAMASYPEYACSPGPFKTDVSGGIFQGIYDPANEKTYLFLQDVLTEVMDLFPSPYIHVGGDEVPKGPWMKNKADLALMEREHLKTPEQLQSYFMTRIGKFVASHGKRMIGWDEILEGGLAPDATVMSWRGTQGGLAAAQADHDVVMSPTSNCYLDYEQGFATEPHEVGNLLDIRKVYTYEPVPDGLAADRVHHILGVQGNLWTEYVPNMPWAEYMTWPREAALAETGWTEPAHRNFDDFARRMLVHEKRLDAMGVNYRPMEDDAIAGAIHLAGDDQKKVVIDTSIADSTIHYTVDGSYPTDTSPAYSEPLALPDGFVHVIARYFRSGTIATPAAAAEFLDGRPVHVTSTTSGEWSTRNKFFFAVRWGIDEGDTINISFDNGPQKLTRIIIQSGDPDKPGTNWQNGVLEISQDSKTYGQSAPFGADGTAELNCDGKPVAAIQIRITKTQKPHPVIRSVTLQ
jgi:hexosaminidase